MRYIIAIALLMTGCSESATELTAWQKAMRDGSVDVVAKQDETLEILKGNTASLTAIKTQIESLEASLVDSKSVRKEDDQQSAPSPPAKANTQNAPLKVATPGDFSRVASDGTRLRWNIEGNWNPTILETSAHLRADHGIDTNGMTHQQMADIHADLHDGKPVAMKARAVQYQTRPTYSIQSGCPGGVCPVPQRVSRRGRR